MSDDLVPISAADAQSQGLVVQTPSPVSAPTPAVPTDLPEGMTPISRQELAASAPGDITYVPGGIRRQEYGTLPEMAKTLGENIASGYTLGASEIGEQAAENNAEAREQRNAENPLTAMAGQGIGMVAAHVTGPGELEDIGRLAKVVNPVRALETAGTKTAQVAEGLGASRRAASALGGAAAFGGMGAIQSVNHELALGDPNLNAGKLVSAAGMGALYAAPFGVAGGVIKDFLSPNIVKAAAQGLADTGEGAEAAAGGSQAGEPIAGAQQAQDAAAQAGTEEQPAPAPMPGQEPDTTGLPKQTALTEALGRLPDLENSVTEQQISSLDNPRNEAIYQTAREMPGDLGDEIRNLEVQQKAELTNKTDGTIQQLAPEAELTPDAVDGGERSNHIFEQTYKNTRDGLVPLFENMKLIDTGTGLNHLQGVMQAVSEKLPQVANMFEDASMEKIKPYKTSMGLDKSVYNAIRDAVDSLKDNPEDFRTLQDIRGGMTQNIDKLASGKGPSQIRAAQAGFMDYLNKLAEEHGEPLIDQSGNEITPREANKRWAIMEGQREVIEKNFGASVGKPEYGEVSRIKPENINDNIFKNTANVNAAKGILSPKDFREILANWLTEKRANFTDNEFFSSNKWRSFLFKNQDALNAAFEDDPEPLQRIRDLNTVSRIIPDAPSANPSHTARTLAYAMKDTFSNPLALLHPVEATGKAVLDFLGEKIQAAHAEAAFRNMKEGAAGVGVMGAIQDMLGSANEKISNAAKSALGAGRGAPVDAASWSLQSYLKNSQRVQKLANDPAAMMDTAQQATAFMHGTAPQISQQIQQHMVTGIQFLASKIPQPLNPQYADGDWEPSNAQKSKFNEYYRTVDDPVASLRQIKNGGLTNETMEALQTVYPSLLDSLRSSVMENMEAGKVSKMPYASQIALSKFLGQPISVGMTPQAVLANQQALQPMPPAAPPQGKAPRGRGASAKNLQLAGRAATEMSRDEES